MAKGVSPTSSTHGEAECAMDAADVSELAVDEVLNFKTFFAFLIIF